MLIRLAYLFMVRAAFALCQQGIVQTWTGDYLAGVTSDEQALPLAHGSVTSVPKRAPASSWLTRSG